MSRLGRGLVLVMACLVTVVYGAVTEAVPAAAETQTQTQTQALILGVLSYRPVDEAQLQWRPLEDYLNLSVPESRFKLRILSLAQMQEAVRLQQVDFVITQPIEYVRMTHQSVLSSPLATLINLDGGKPVKAFGGVILTRLDMGQINSLQDLKGRSVAVSSVDAFGAYQMQAQVLSRAGVELGTVVETGLPQDLAIKALLQKRTDVAFVRSGVIEAMAREGKLDLGQLKVINRQSLAGYPFAVSTQLFPEWPVVALPHVPEPLAVRVAGALLSMPHGGALAASMGMHGFTVPADYEAVRSLMRELRVPPFNVHTKVKLGDIWRQYRLALIALMAAALAVVALAARATLLSRRLRSITETMGEGLYVVNAAGIITFVNSAAQCLLGYARDELLGQPISRFTKNPHQLRHDQSGELSFVAKGGREFPAEVSCQPMRSGGRFEQTVAVFGDISERKAQAADIYQLAFYDPLTGLPNRRKLLQCIAETTALQTATQAGSAQLHGLLLMDLDHFKTLNDTLGHQVGNALLNAVALRLRALFGAPCTLARLGGDEFGVLIEVSSGDDGMATALAQAQALVQDFEKPFDVEGQLHHLTASIGVVLCNAPNVDADEWLKRADIAMYQAKAGGRNTYRVFDAAIAAELAERAALEADLRLALQEQQFALHYQVQVDAQGRALGVEALVRWLHPRRGMVSPAAFIPMAEETGLILPLGQWVMEQACRQLAAWQKPGPQSSWVVSVNVSAHQIFQPDFVARVGSALEQSGADPRLLQIELTESVLARNMDDIIGKMKQLNALGVTFSLDDFGTGYSSLAYLKRLPLHQLKIDASFVRDILNDTNDAAITRTVIALGQSLGLEVIAEGVERTEQRDLLLSQGCRNFQGYLFGRPAPASTLDGH